MRRYWRGECVSFRKTSEAFGGLSNMAGGYPLLVNGRRVLTSEALYQACRFPQQPEIQALIIGQRSPMAAKMVGKPYRASTRPDWESVRVKVMRWALRVKLVQNRDAFGELLEQTGSLPIVEDSHRDDFWGATPVDDDQLVGQNILGRLLMELREEVRREPEALTAVLPPSLPSFLFMGEPIGPVSGVRAVDERQSSAARRQPALALT